MMLRKSDYGIIRQRTYDGLWEARIVVGPKKNGCITKSVFAETQEECYEKYLELKKRYWVFDSDECFPEMPINRWLEIWLSYNKAHVAEISYRTYLRYYENNWKPALEGKRLCDVTGGFLEVYYAFLRKGGESKTTGLFQRPLSPHTINGMHRMMVAACNCATALGLLSHNPARHCVLPRKKMREIEVFPKEDLQRILGVISETKVYPLYLLAAATGLTAAELTALRWSDFKAKTGDLSVTNGVRYIDKVPSVYPLTKPGQKRVIVVPEEVVKVLREYRKSVKSVWIFPSLFHSRENYPRNPSSLDGEFRRFQRLAGCEPLSFSSLRHTYAVEMLNIGMNTKTLACVLGFKSIAPIKRSYAKLRLPNKIDAANRIETALAPVVSLS